MLSAMVTVTPSSVRSPPRMQVLASIASPAGVATRAGRAPVDGWSMPWGVKVKPGTSVQWVSFSWLKALAPVADVAGTLIRAGGAEVAGTNFAVKFSLIRRPFRLKVLSLPPVKVIAAPRIKVGRQPSAALSSTVTPGERFTFKINGAADVTPGLG